MIFLRSIGFMSIFVIFCTPHIWCMELEKKDKTTNDLALQEEVRMAANLTSIQVAREKLDASGKVASPIEKNKNQRCASCKEGCVECTTDWVELCRPACKANGPLLCPCIFGVSSTIVVMGIASTIYLITHSG